MNFTELYDIIVKDSETISPGEMAINLTAYYKDICNYAEPILSVGSWTADGETIDLGFNDFSGHTEDTFMKLYSVHINEVAIRPRSQATDFDLVYEETISGLRVGILRNGKLKPLSSGKVVEIVFYSYPEPVSVESEILPLPQVHNMLLWRLKADVFAEKRQWDRSGYYNRRYEKSLYEYRKMINSQGAKKIIHTNDRI